MGRLLTVSTAALAVLVLGAGAASADHGVDSASGHVNNHFGEFDVDFSARASSVGTAARGRFRLTRTSSDPNQVFVGEVTCLVVEGGSAGTPASASVSGVITDQPPGSGATAFVMIASDDGKFSQTPDRFDAALYNGPPACPPVPGTLTPVADGEIVIHNTLP
jgi:hypothetical protein